MFDADNVEMTTMSVIGVAVSAGVLYGLTAAPAGYESGTEEALEDVSRQLMDSVIPDTATDLFSLVLGEGVAGLFGAVTNAVVTVLLRSRDRASRSFAVRRGNADNDEDVEEVRYEIASNDDEGTAAVTAEAVADADYFLTRAAALPLLEGLGLPPGPVIVLSTLVATVPYEIIKLNGFRRQQKQKQLRDDVEEEGDGSQISFADTDIEIDVIELLADTTKWLEYTVLVRDFSSYLIPGHPVLESTAYGFLSALSSQVYADALYLYTDYGPERTTAAVRSRRSIEAWASAYVTRCFSNAALFGSYESARLPLTRFFQSVLTGGVDNCLGSRDFTLCVETFRIDNPPSDMAGADAQIRALATALVGMADRLGIRVDGAVAAATDDNVAANVRALVVSLYSYYSSNFMPLF